MNMAGEDTFCSTVMQAELYGEGEELFALRSTQYPELTKTKKEANLLDQLYGLYMDVIHALEVKIRIPFVSILRLHEPKDNIPSPISTSLACALHVHSLVATSSWRTVRNRSIQYLSQGLSERHTSHSTHCFLDRYREILWTSVEDELAPMAETVASFDACCRKMPRKLREWEAFQASTLIPRFHCSPIRLPNGI